MLKALAVSYVIHVLIQDAGIRSDQPLLHLPVELEYAQYAFYLKQSLSYTFLFYS